MKRAFLLAATMALAVSLASGTAVSQAAAPEHELYEFASQIRPGEGIHEIVEVDSQDNVYVPTYSGINKYAPDGTPIETWERRTTVFDMAVDSQDNVYLYGYTGPGSSHDKEIYVRKHAPDGTVLTEWGSRGTGDGQFGGYGGIAIDPEDNVYVTDVYNDRVQKFASDGTFLGKWSSDPPGEYDSNYGPDKIAVDSRGHVYLDAYYGGKVLEFTNDGTFINERRGFRNIGDITVDARDNLYVADFWGDRVEKFAPDGSFVTGWGTEGEGDGQLDGPAGIAIDSGGAAYVADSWNRRVQKFELVEDTVAPDGVAYRDYLGYDFSDGLRRYSQDFTLTLDGRDQGVGTDKVTYEATGTQEIPSTTADAPTQVRIDTEGKMTITHSATDRAGNVGQTETTTIILDKTSPKVAETVPEAGAAKVGREVRVSATFSEAMNTGDLSRRAFRFYEAKSLDAVPATFSYDEQTDTAALNPKVPLKAGVSYRVIVGARKAYDLAGNRLDQNEALEGIQPKKWGFTVEN